MTRFSQIGLVALLITAWFACVLTFADTAARTTASSSASVPADILARSDAARTHMKQLAAALRTYANTHGGLLPSDLKALYPQYISNPRVFWHPGDADPQPTTIDNNTPNQLNSTRISFEFTSAGNLDHLGRDEPLIWDNSSANNGGLFATTLTAGGVFKTSPAWITPTPTRLEVARGNLRSLAMACATYAAGNSDTFPTDLAQLAEWCSPSTFWNPGDGDPEPTAITNSVPNAANSAQISFAYLGGRNRGGGILMLDNSFANNEGGSGVLVAGTDYSVSFFGRSSRCPDLSGTARQHLQQIGAALLVYAADHDDHFPPALSSLFPSYISDPAVFWNPGDSNPCPTTINNDQPDAANSAQVSFRYLGATYNANCNPLTVLAIDSSLANNSMSGINILTANGAVDFYAAPPPSCQDPPACFTLAAANLRAIGLGLAIYATENMDSYPPTLSTLYPNYVSDPAVFWNPGDSDASPLTIDNDVLNQPNSAQISFEYLGPGDGPNSDPSEIVVRDNSPANNGGRGINVLYYDGHVQYIASVTPTSLTVAGAEAVPAGGFEHYTCNATYSDGSTWDVTPYATWSVTSGPGAISDQGTFVAPARVTQTASATIHVSYKEGGVTRQADKVITVTACHEPFADADGDGDVDVADYAVFQRCLNPGGTLSAICGCFDRPIPPGVQGDGDVDEDDFLAFVACASGPGIPAQKTCGN